MPGLVRFRQLYDSIKKNYLKFVIREIQKVPRQAIQNGQR